VIKRIRIIGIGMGDPDQVTGEAARALGAVDVFIVADEVEVGADLVAVRRRVCDSLIPSDRPYRLVEVTDPRPGSNAERDLAAYGQGVRDGHLARIDACAEVLEALPAEETTAGFLVWGDPALHDSTIRVVEALVARWAARGVTVDHDVIAGISAPQLLAARHRISLGRNGAPVHITTGRRLVDEFDPGLGDVVVMLDGQLACAALVDGYPDLELCWGAYLGSPDELLVRGRLADVIEEVSRVRAAARARHGWVMDTYLLRHPDDAPPPSHVGPALTPFPDPGQWAPLSDGVVSLRPLTPADWPVVLDEHNNEESLRWGFDSEAMTESAARHKAAEAPREWRRGRAARFVIVDDATGERAGVLMVIRMGPPGVGLVGYGVVPRWRGRGFTTRALRLVAEWAFADTDLERLELGHKVGNVASGKAALRAGFTVEGLLSGRLPNPDGSRSDEVTYALTRHEQAPRGP
jgi:precorrin-6A synthase (deacetylating)